MVALYQLEQYTIPSDSKLLIEKKIVTGILYCKILSQETYYTF